MWNHIKKMLSGLQGHKKDHAPVTNILTFSWLVGIILAFMLRLHKGGISSLQRALNIDPSHYSSMDDVFRSDAINLPAIREYWPKMIVREMTPYTVDEKYVYTGDGVLQAKEGRRQPGVTRHHKESGTQTKPTSFHGIHTGFIDIITVSPDGKLYATPIWAELMDGLGPVAQWENSNKPHADQTLEWQEVVCASKITNQLKHDGIYLTDKASMNREILKELTARNESSAYKLAMIVPAKKNCTAYEKPVIDPHKKGRPPVKGKDVKLKDWVNESDGWEEVRLSAYGKEHDARCKTAVFLWGKQLYQELRFVAVDLRNGRGVFILTCSDPTLNAASVAELYCKRFLCEEGFKQYKTVFHGLDMHFWSKSHPWNSFIAPKDSPHVLEGVEDSAKQKHIMKTIDAIDLYLQLALMAQGIAQKIASEQEIGGAIHKFTSKRSRNAVKVSEEDVCNYLSAHIDLLFDKYSDDALIQFILGKQIVEDEKIAYNLL